MTTEAKSEAQKKRERAKRRKQRDTARVKEARDHTIVRTMHEIARGPLGPALYARHQDPKKFAAATYEIAVALTDEWQTRTGKPIPW